MIYANLSRAPSVADAEGSSRRRPSLLTIILRAMMESRQRHAERVVADLIQLRGGRLTDDVERRISDLSPEGDRAAQC